MPAFVEARTAPGHLIRRAQQAHSTLWVQEVGDHLTSIQFVILNCLRRLPNIDQTRLGDQTDMDRSTVGDVVSRLVQRGLVERTRDQLDGRRNVLRLTNSGKRVHAKAMPAVETLSSRLLAPLTTAEGSELMRLLTKLVEGLELSADDQVTAVQETAAGC